MAFVSLEAQGATLCKCHSDDDSTGSLALLDLFIQLSRWDDFTTAYTNSWHVCWELRAMSFCNNRFMTRCQNLSTSGKKLQHPNPQHTFSSTWCFLFFQTPCSIFHKHHVHQKQRPCPLSPPWASATPQTSPISWRASCSSRGPATWATLWVTWQCKKTLRSEWCCFVIVWHVSFATVYTLYVFGWF